MGYISVVKGYDEDGNKVTFDGKDKISLFTSLAVDAKAANNDMETKNGVNLHMVSLATSHLAAAEALTNIRVCLNAVSIMRGRIGAGMNRLNAAVAVMQTQARNTLAAESQIRDANMAEEITNLTKYQILAQTGIAALAHSNNNSQTVLNLLR